jgi:hypothetical protein
MLDVRFRPLEKWREKTPLGSKNGQFKMPFNDTLDHLEYELRALKATDVLIEAGFSLAQIRNDGWPRGGQEPNHAGVVLYFKRGADTLRFACGTYRTWRQNLHAVMLTLEALRAIDRYGATSGHEQYTGFKQLPPGTESVWSVDSAATWLAARTPWVKDGAAIIDDYDTYRRAYRESAASLHPDRGGSTELFQALGEVARVLEAHHAKRAQPGANGAATASGGAVARG